MTVAVIVPGLLPIFWGSGAGSEVMSRSAAPMVYGHLPRTAPSPAVGFNGESNETIAARLRTPSFCMAMLPILGLPETSRSHRQRGPMVRHLRIRAGAVSLTAAAERLLQNAAWRFPPWSQRVNRKQTSLSGS
jgi:hypothetical protein